MRDAVAKYLVKDRRSTVNVLPPGKAAPPNTGKSPAKKEEKAR